MAAVPLAEYPFESVATNTNVYFVLAVNPVVVKVGFGANEIAVGDVYCNTLSETNPKYRFAT